MGEKPVAIAGSQSFPGLQEAIDQSQPRNPRNNKMQVSYVSLVWLPNDTGRCKLYFYSDLQ